VGAAEKARPVFVSPVITTTAPAHRSSTPPKERCRDQQTGKFVSCNQEGN
jgi:hypothetical protein